MKARFFGYLPKDGIKFLDLFSICPIIFLDLLPVRHAARPRAGLFFWGVIHACRAPHQTNHLLH
jgi:hypothetical protein